MTILCDPYEFTTAMKGLLFSLIPRIGLIYLNLAVPAIPFLLTFRSNSRKVRGTVSSDRRINFDYPYRLGRNFYKTIRNNAIAWILDSTVNSARMMLAFVDSLEYRVQFRFIFNKIEKSKAEKMIRSMMAERLSEVRMNRSKRDSYENTLKRQIAYLEGLFRDMSSLDSSIFDVYMVFKTNEDHPVSLSRHLERFASSMKMLGFVLESTRGYTKKHISRYGDIFEKVGRRYLADSDALSEIFPVSLTAPPENSGIVIGVHSITEKPIFLDIFGRNSFNVMIFGQTGSGKSFLSKLMMMRYVNTGLVDQLMVVDPLDEYSCSLFNRECREVRLVKGEYVDIIQLYRDSDELVSSFSIILSDLIENEIPSNDVYNLLRKYLQREKAPTIHGLLQSIKDSVTSEKTKKMLSELMENTFNSEKRLDITDRTKVLIFKPGSISEESRSTGTLTVLLNIMHRIRESPGTRKIVLVDEAHLITKNVSGSRLLSNLVRHSRHYNTAVINVTQNVGDLLNDVDSKSIMMNSELTFLFRTKTSADIEHTLFRIDDVQELSLEDLAGGSNELYSECYFIDRDSINKTRIICTENEKKMIDELG